MCTSGHSRPGFTLVEAMIAISLTALSASVLLVGINASVKVTDDAMNETIAMGIAQQLMDEIVAKPRGDGITRTATTRNGLKDIDDYIGYSKAPEDRWAIPLGKEDSDGRYRQDNFKIDSDLLLRLRVQVSVRATDANGNSVSLTSNPLYYSVQVSVVDTAQGWRVLATLNRTVAYVD
jgi:type II secretory pathway pseudopilin PulG